MEAALGPPAVQSSGAPVPDGPGGPERESAGDQRGPDLQVRHGAPGLALSLCVPPSAHFKAISLFLDRGGCSSGLLLKKSGLNITER